MIALESRDFDELCRLPSVRGKLATMEAERSAALKRFWLLCLGIVLASAGVAYLLYLAGYPTVAFVAGALILIFGVVIAYAPLAGIGRGLKDPFLEALAARSGMDYFPSDFAPPLYPEAKDALFGTWISSESFSDLFNGRDEKGRGIAIYECVLERGSGRSRHIAFQGQVYALQCNDRGGAVTVIVPDRGLLNVFKPSGGFERVKLDDPEFERRFEVYSTDRAAAKQMLFDTDLRLLLLDLGAGGRKGRLLAYVGPEGALVAVHGADRFEPGTMFRAKDSAERARSMFEDFRGSMATLKALRAVLD